MVRHGGGAAGQGTSLVRSVQDRRGCSRSFSLSLFLSLYSCSRGLLAVPEQGSVALPQGPTAAPRHHRLLAVGQQQEIKSRASMRAPVRPSSRTSPCLRRCLEGCPISSHLLQCFLRRMSLEVPEQYNSISSHVPARVDTVYCVGYADSF